jgi:hypothetical protein
MNAAKLTIRAVIYVFDGDQPIARTPEAEDAYYATYGGKWIDAIVQFFARTRPLLAISDRVTIVPSIVKLA